MVFVAKDLEDGIGSEKKARITKYVERFKDLEFISGSFDSTKILLDKRLITPEHVMNNLNRNLNSLRILEEGLGAEGKNMEKSEWVVVIWNTWNLRELFLVDMTSWRREKIG